MMMVYVECNRLSPISINIHENVERKPVITLGRRWQDAFTMDKEEAIEVARKILELCDDAKI